MLHPVSKARYTQINPNATIYWIYEFTTTKDSTQKYGLKCRPFSGSDWCGGASNMQTQLGI
jgi:hypothetical protein